MNRNDEVSHVRLPQIERTIKKWKNRIKVTEPFSAEGKPLHALLEDVIQFSAKQQDDKTRPAC